jgi:Family of unknown function (DUF6010)
MMLQPRPELSLLNVVAPVVIALLCIGAFSLLKEPARRNLSALMISGAGAAYLNGGMLGWEFAFCAVMTGVAYLGLRDYKFIGLGWLLHTGWDVVHHLYGNPIVPFAPLSSFGCAVCDPVLALWYFMGAPPIQTWFRKAHGARSRPEAVSRVP